MESQLLSFSLSKYQKAENSDDRKSTIFFTFQHCATTMAAIVFILELFIGHQNHLVAASVADPSDAYFLLLLRIRKGISRQPPGLNAFMQRLVLAFAWEQENPPQSWLKLLAASLLLLCLDGPPHCNLLKDDAKKHFPSIESQVKTENLNSSASQLCFHFSPQLIQFPHFP